MGSCWERVGLGMGTEAWGGAEGGREGRRLGEGLREGGVRQGDGGLGRS